MSCDGKSNAGHVPSTLGCLCDVPTGITPVKGEVPMFKKLLELLTLKWLWDRR
jgi:hypothetical protein